MKLGDLLAVINEHEHVLVSVDDYVVASYDGKDAVDPKWNDCEVTEVSADHIGRNLFIDIKEEEQW